MMLLRSYEVSVELPLGFSNPPSFGLGLFLLLAPLPLEFGCDRLSVMLVRRLNPPVEILHVTLNFVVGRREPDGAPAQLGGMHA